MSGGPRVGVLGGGVLGVSTATHLARSGASVVLVTDGALTSRASGRSLSWLNSSGRRRPEYHRLRVAGLDRYRALSARHPDAPWLRFDGGLRWTDRDAAGVLLATHEHERSIGYDSVWLTPDQVRERFPAVEASAVPAEGGIWNPGEGWVDLPSLVRLLVDELRAAGGEVVTDAGPTRLETAAGRVTALRTGRGDRWRVDAGVLATGAAVPQAAAELGVLIPEATPLALLVRTRPVATGLRQVLNTPRAAVRPTPDGGLAVDADWVSTSIVGTADAWSAPDAVVDDLLEEAGRVLAGRPRLRPGSVGIVRKPIPADGEPVIGALPGVPGAYVAFTHSGATLGLVAGELLADQVLTGEQPALLSTFTPDRFGRSAAQLPGRPAAGAAPPTR